MVNIDQMRWNQKWNIQVIVWHNNFNVLKTNLPKDQMYLSKEIIRQLHQRSTNYCLVDRLWVLVSYSNTIYKDSSGNQRTRLSRLDRDATVNYVYFDQDCSVIVDVKLCDDIKCANGGTCKDTLSGFKCTCASGYKGLKCEEGRFLTKQVYKYWRPLNITNEVAIIPRILM